MTARIIDGAKVAADMRAELKEQVAELKKKGIVPGLGVVLVGEDPASKSYVTAKERACAEIGIYSDDNRLSAQTSQNDLITLIKKMKDKIHPKYYNDAQIICSCGNTFTTGSTKKTMRVELCSACHPFYTGERRMIDTAGRVERFKQRYSIK